MTKIRPLLLLSLALMTLMSLVGCYAVGHQFHTPAEHERIMQQMNDPEPPGGY